MRSFTLILISVLFHSCTSSDLISDNENSLLEHLKGKTFEEDAVIACAASDPNDNSLLNVYFYPEQGATNFKYYETATSNVDPNNFANYSFLNITDNPLFDGTLRQFNKQNTNEQWVIVTYEVEQSVKISTPIRIKNISQPTVWNDEVTINQEDAGMPLFDWDVASEENNAIFFQVVSTSENVFLSGTYTTESQFKYYNLDNVVLNVTEGIPPNLISGETYRITIMDVSIDNWVNTVIEKSFIAE